MSPPDSKDPSPRPQPEQPGGSVDLDHVNVLQQAILERVRQHNERGPWLPKITRAQWIVSLVIAVILVSGIFKVVDSGLTALQKFFELYSTEPAPEGQEAPAVDVSEPLPVIVVPQVDETSPPAPPPAAE